MPYPANAVANELIDRAAESGTPLTQINIQKLVYFAHGWNFAWFDKPLSEEHFEAWQYGPVVRTLYRQFRRFGSERITEKAVDLSFNSLGNIVSCVPSIPESADGSLAKSAIGAVWKHYGTMQPFQLVELTH